jgi:hypothetical protein
MRWINRITKEYLGLNELFAEEHFENYIQKIIDQFINKILILDINHSIIPLNK